jgi:membrane protein DedA with SNARE-associated domain
MLGGVNALAASSATSSLPSWLQWLVDLMNNLGLLGAAIGSGLDSFFPFIPSEVILPIVGFTAGRPGGYPLWAALIAVNVGSLVGAGLMYWASVWFGRDRTAWIFDNVWLLKVDDLEKAEAWFARWGSWAVFLARMMPGIRCLISVPAGIERMNFGKFLVLSLLGSAIWNSLLVYAGYALGDNWHLIDPYMHWLTLITVGLLTVLVAAFLWVRIRELRRGEL